MRRFAAWVTACRRKINSSLAAKTFCMLLVLLLVFCAVIYAFISLFLPLANENRLRNALDAQTKDLISNLRQSNAAQSRAFFLQFMVETGADLFLLDANGYELDLFTYEPTSTEGASGRAYPFRFAGSGGEYELLVRFNPQRSLELRRAILQSMPWAGGAILILSFLSAFFFSRYMARPIVRISKIAAGIADLDFSWYCPDERADEIGVLSKSINNLSDELNAALSSLQQHNAVLENEISLEKERERKRMLFFAAVSHELKTPVAIVIGQLEGMRNSVGVYKDRDKYLTRAAEILERLNTFIKEVLSISYIDIERAADARVSLSALLGAAAADCHTLADTRGVHLQTNIDDGLHTRGTSMLLQKAFVNIIENAVQYTRAYGLVSVCLRQDNSSVVCTVTNSPAHIGEEHLPHVFEAFYRAAPASGGDGAHGSGLGLYMTKMILESHNAPHSIANSAGGVVFTASFCLEED